MRVGTGWRGLAVVVAGLACAPARADLFVAGFESTDTPAYTVGEQLHHAGGEPYRWNWSGDNIGVISSSGDAVLSGSQGLDATRSSTANSQVWWTRPGVFSPVSAGVLSLRAAVRASGWANSPDSFLELVASDIAVDDVGANSTRSAWLTLKGNGNLYAWNGSGSESQVASGLDVTQWQELRVDVDLDGDTYDVFLNGTQVGTDFAFYGSGVSEVRSLQFKEYNNGQSSGGVYLDDVSVAIVPEPSLVSLLLIGSLAAWRRAAGRR
jgi:hypothetical protein